MLSSNFRMNVTPATAAMTMMEYGRRRICSASFSSSFAGRTRRTNPGDGLCRKRKFTTKTPIVMMPEGPEVRTLVDQLQPAVGMTLKGIKIWSGRYTKERNGPPKGFEEFFDDHSSSNIITSFKAKGKFIYMLLDESNDDDDDGVGNGSMRNYSTTNDDGSRDDFLKSIWITLGMTGKFISETHLNDRMRSSSSMTATSHVNANDNNESFYERNHIRWQLQLEKGDSKTNIYYQDVRNFGTLKFCFSRSELETKLNKMLGPDILQPEFTQDVFLQILHKYLKQNNICQLLMDQKKICGIGNYILAESLYKSHIDPFCTVDEISTEKKSLLYDAIVAISQASYQSQGATLYSYKTPDGKSGEYQFQLECYGRQYDNQGQTIIKDVDGPHGRTIWYIEDQLFMPLHERRKKQQQQQQQQQTSNQSTSTKELSSNNVPTNNNGRNNNNIVITSNDLSSLIVEPSWRNVLLFDGKNDTQKQDEQDEKYSDIVDVTTRHDNNHREEELLFQDVAQFLSKELKEYRPQVIYPPMKELFNSLNYTPLDKIKVVIVGQDPYHQPNQGHGLAFSVKHGVKIPPSLRNIYKELSSSIKNFSLPNHGCLERWAKEEGILLLNTVLTVRHSQANSHKTIAGWEPFTDRILEAIMLYDNDNNNDNGVVFLVWGKQAQDKIQTLLEQQHSSLRRNICVIGTSHPSPLSATKTSQPFLGSNCFLKTNEQLIQWNMKPINWNID